MKLPKKVLINLGIILFCGTVALSITVIVNHLQKPGNTNTHQEFTQPIATDWELVSVFVGDRYQDKIDATIIWQIEQRRGETVVATWDDIYSRIDKTNPLTYDSEHLMLTRYGLVYRGLRSTEDYQNLFASEYQTTVIYQNHSCVLTLN